MEGTAGAKALRSELVWYMRKTARTLAVARLSEGEGMRGCLGMSVWLKRAC